MGKTNSHRQLSSLATFLFVVSFTVVGLFAISEFLGTPQTVEATHSCSVTWSGSGQCPGACFASESCSDSCDSYSYACSKDGAQTYSGSGQCPGACFASETCSDSCNSYSYECTYCAPDCVATQGNACNINACGTAGGTVNCDDTCSGSTPAIPYTVGAACTSAANNCGATNSGTITNQCTGACSASAPADVTGLGGACTSSANVCGATNSGTYVCNATGTGSTCSASTPANPDACARCNNVGECNSGYQCSGAGTCSVSAPADRATSCRGGAGGGLSSGVNSGAFPEYFGIANAWNNVTCGPSSTYSCPAGSTTKVYLTYGTETNYDFVKIYNGAGSLLEQFSGNSGYVWKGPYATSSLQFGFSSDVSTPGANFDIWKVECIVPADAIAPSVSANNASSSWFTSRTTTLSVSDAGGVNQARYSWDSNPMNAACTSGGTTFTNGASLTVSAGSHRLYLCARDNAGNTNTWDSGADKYRVDAAKPTSVISPAPSAWQRAGFTVSVSDSDPGGSGFFIDGGRYHVFGGPSLGQTVSDAQRTLSSSTPSIPVGSGATNGCYIEGSQTCQVQVFARDQAGNEGRITAPAGETPEGDFVTVSIDYTPPSVGAISPTSAITGTAVTLSAVVSDVTSGLSFCNLFVGGIDRGAMTISGGTASKSYTFTSSGTYQVHASCQDNAGNYRAGSDVPVVVGDPTLTYPSGTWQRLWYSTSGASPIFSTGNFLGEGPNESSLTFTTDWVSSSPAYSRPNDIGFKSSRTINFPTEGLYRFTIGSDDGARLYIDNVNDVDTPTINMWSDDGYRTQSANVNISAGNHIFRLDYYEHTGDAKVSFNYEALPVAPAPSGVNTDPSDTAIYVSWNSVGGISSATYRLEWCKKSVIDAGGSFSSAACGPPNSPAGGPPYFLTTTATSGYIIGTDVATAYNVRVRVDSGTSASYIFPGNWASASATTRTPLSCNNVNPTNTASGSSVTNDCFQDERRCGPIDTEAGCTAACFFGDNYLSTGLNPITQIGTITTGKWRVTGSASYDLFAQGHGVECIGPDWRSWIYNVQAFMYLKYPSPIDTASSSQSLDWTLTGEGGQEFSLPGAATLTFDKVFTCPDASCDLWFYSTFSGNTWAHKQFFPGGGGDYVRQLAVMDTNFSWVRVDETAPGVPTINTPQDQWRKENPTTNMTVTDDIALSEIGYALKGKDCTFPADPCSEADWKRAQKSDLSGDLAPGGTSATADWKMSNADWGRFDEGPNTLYLRVKDAAGNCRGCDDGTKIQFGVKKDTVAPTSKITTVDTYDAVEDVYKKPGVRLNYPFAGQSSAFLRADDEGDTKRTWWMYVVDADTGSGLNTCSISINGIAKPDRSCAAGWLTFTVGKTGTGADCTEEGDDACIVKVWARDTVGNTTITKNVSVAFLGKEKDYLEGLVTQDANEFSFSVDWQKPTAQ